MKLDAQALGALPSPDLVDALEAEIGKGDRADFHGAIDPLLGEVRRRLDQLEWVIAPGEDA